METAEIEEIGWRPILLFEEKAPEILQRDQWIRSIPGPHQILSDRGYDTRARPVRCTMDGNAVVVSRGNLKISPYKNCE
jgi:hypothetical protein